MFDATPLSRRLCARRILASTTALITLVAAAPAFAQSTAAPPPYDNVDSNGVDLVTGRYVFTLTEGSIGSGEGAVSLVRGHGPDQWSGRLYRKTAGGQSLTYVELGRTSDTFTRNGSTYVPTKGNGATLVELSGFKYLYTAPDGTKILYESAVTQNGPFLTVPYTIDGPGCQGTDPGTCAIPISITRPDGMTFTLNWDFDLECGGTTLPCPDPKAYFRFDGVTSSAHYSFSLTYLTDDPGNFNQPQPDWFTRTGATFTNTVNPPSPLPTISYARPSNEVELLTQSDGGVWRFTYSGTTTRIRRPGSASDDIVVTYAAGGGVSSVTRDGVTTDYHRTVSDSTATMTVTDALGHVTTIVSDLSKGRPTSTTDALGNVTGYSYDSSGRLTRVTYPENNTIAYTHDARGNVTETRATSKTPGTPADIVTSASYPSSCANVVTCNRPTWTRDAKGHQTDYTYDATTGQVLTVTAPAPTTGGTRPKTTYGYTAVNGVSLVQTISACAAGATCAGTADEAETAITYNGYLLPATVTAKAGNGSVSATSAYAYDSIGNVLTIDGPLSGTADTTTYRYNAAREVTGVIAPDPDGSGSLERRARRTSYDAAGRLTEVEIGTVTGTSDTAWAAFVSKQQVTSSYDSHGRKTKDVLTAGGATYGVTQYSYDALGRIECTAARMNDAAWGTLPASACTLQAAGSAGPDRITRATYDALGRIEKTVSGYGTAVAAADATASYTDNGRLATLTDGEGNATTYAYDGFDRLAKTRYPSKTTAGVSSTTDYESLGYDANGNVVSRRLRDGRSIAYAYDNLNRLVAKNLPGTEPTATYAYDLLGRPLSASQGGTTLAFGYDALGRPLTQTGPHGTLSSSFDAAGRRTRLTWDDGLFVDYDYLVTGEVSEIRENGATSGVGVLARYSYDDLGQLVHAVYGNGTASNFDPDPVERLRQFYHNLGGASADLTATFTFNPAGQIASLQRSNDAYAWTDAVDATRAYTANGLNQYTAAGAVTFDHDARGNLTRSGSDTYAYASENLLKSGPGVALAYDPLMRLAEVTGSTTTRFAYDGLDLVAEYNASGTMLRRYVHAPGIDTPIVWYEGSGTSDRRWFAADERGSIIAVSDDTGAPLGINTYDEYGIPGASNIGRFQYTGQAWLPELGLSYYKARMYAPSLGRFMQTDPIGYADGMNWYAYVGNDPINFVDPLGLRWERYCAPGDDGRIYCAWIDNPGYHEPEAPSSSASVWLRGGSAGVLGQGDRQVHRGGAGTILGLSQNTGSQCARGQQASRISTGTDYAGPLHDYFSRSVEAGGGKAAAKFLGPTGYLISAIGAGSTFVLSLQRGEPFDVAIVRATAPLAGGVFGGYGGAIAGAAAGGAAGSAVPVLGNGVGAVGGFVAGGVVGSVIGDKIGVIAAEEYAEARGYGGC